MHRFQKTTRFLQRLAVFSVFIAAIPAHAQTANLSQARCGNINELSKNDQQSMLFWLNGYYAGAGQRSSLDTRQVQSSVSAMLEACAKNPALPLIGVEARQIFLPAQEGNATPFQETSPQNRIVIPDATPVDSAPQNGVSGSPSRSMTGGGNQRTPQPVP
jgi:HdeA/HdeB family